MTVRGRPRGFDRDEALKRAMETFWALGYDGASIAELTRAMGVAPPSLYAAFGSKDALFREVLALYERSVGCEIVSEVEAAPTARAAVEAFLRASARSLSRPGRPPGCMIVLTAVNARGAGPELCEALRGSRRGAVAALERRLARGVADRDLPPCLNLSAIASFYVAVQQGMSIQARDGSTAAELGAIAAAAMAAWDGLVAGGLAVGFAGGLAEASGPAAPRC